VPRDTGTLEMSEHCRAVDVEVSGELGYGVPFLVRGDEPLHGSASEPALDLSTARSDPCDGPGVDVFSALMTTKSLITGLSEVNRGV